MRRSITLVLLTLVGLFLLACLGGALPLDFAVSLTFGWAIYLWRVLPQVTIDRGGAFTAVLCLALFVAGSHAFLGWLCGQVRAGDDPEGSEGRRWKPRWTIALASTIVLMFVAGLSAAGVVHQVGWLLNSEEPLVGSSMLGAARRSQSINNLKQIGLGLRDFHEAHASLPPGGTFDDAGRPVHGWQAMLLPYVGHADLYNRIDFGVPWDHPRNRGAFQTRVTLYRNPGIFHPTDGSAYALGDYSGNVRLLGGDVPRTFADVKDGGSVTLMAGEVAAGSKPWGYPANWRDPALGINRSSGGFGGPYPGGANFLFVDGSVRFLKDGIDPKVLKSLSTPAGGEPVLP